jgi:hypothetical protein
LSGFQLKDDFEGAAGKRRLLDEGTVRPRPKLARYLVKEDATGERRAGTPLKLLSSFQPVNELGEGGVLRGVDETRGLGRREERFLDPLGVRQ